MALGATRRLSLLRRNRGFALLFWATAGSAVGTYLAALALSVDILDRTDSGRWLAAGSCCRWFGALGGLGAHAG